MWRKNLIDESDLIADGDSSSDRNPQVQKDSDRSAALVAGRILEAVELLRTQPQMGRPGHLSGTCELVVPGTPYIVPYPVRRERLELLAVFDGRRRWPRKF